MKKKANNRRTNEFESISLLEDVMWYVLMFGFWIVAFDSNWSWIIHWATSWDPFWIHTHSCTLTLIRPSDIIKQIVLSVRPLYPEPEKRRKPFTIFDKILMCAPNSGQFLDSPHMSVYVDELNSIVVAPCVHWLMLNFDQCYFSIYYSVYSRMRHMDILQLFASEFDQYSIDSGIDAQICSSFFIACCLKSQVIHIRN